MDEVKQPQDKGGESSAPRGVSSSLPRPEVPVSPPSVVQPPPARPPIQPLSQPTSGPAPLGVKGGVGKAEPIGEGEKVAAEEAAKGIIRGGKGSWWMWILVVLLLLVSGGIIYWLVRVNAVGVFKGEETGPAVTVTVTPSLTPTPAEDVVTEELLWQGSSDETEAIEADLNASDYSNLTPELDEIERELAE